MSTTIKSLAMSYATKQNSADNAEKRLSLHAEFEEYVARASAPKTGKASPFVAVAKELLNVTDERGTKTGPKGAQVYTKYGNGVTGQHVQNVADLLKRHAVKADAPVALRVTLSGEGGGSFTVPTDHEHYALIAGLINA